MNFNGGYDKSNLEDGGKISGDLDVEGNLTLTDFTANNGVVINNLEVGTLVSDIQVEDPIIIVGKSNPSDNLNLGIVEEFENGGTKYSAILRSKDDKEHYVLENLTTIPNGASNITTLNKGNLNCAKLTADNITVNNYALPAIDGNIGDVMTTNGAGVISFTPSNGDVSSSSALSVDDEICVFDGITGKLIKNSNISASNISQNPAIATQDMNSFDINNINQINAERFVINKWSLTPNGRLLQINSSGTNQGSSNLAGDSGRIDLEKNANSDFPEISLGRSRGTYASPTAVQVNNVLCEINFKGNDGSSPIAVKTGFIRSAALENFTPTARGSAITFHTTTPGTTTIDQRMKIEAQGVTVQGDLSVSQTLSGESVSANSVIFERPTNAIRKSVVWATTNDLADRWVLGSEVSTQNLTLQNAALQNVLSATQAGDLTVLQGVSSKRSTTTGVKGSTVWDIDGPAVRFTQFYQSAKGGVIDSVVRGRGSPSAPVGLIDDDIIQTQTGFTSDGATIKAAFNILSKTTQDHTPGNHGTKLIFSTTNNNTDTLTEKVRLDTSGVTLNDAYTMPLTDGQAGQILETDGAGQVSWIYRSYGEMGIQGSTTQTTFTAGSTDEWKTIAGTYVQGCVGDFSFITPANQLRYDGSITKLFRVTAGASITKNQSGSALCRMAVFINGFEVARSKQVQSTSNSSVYPQHLSSDCLVSIATNDFIEIKIQNGTDDESLTVTNLSVIVTQA